MVFIAGGAILIYNIAILLHIFNEAIAIAPTELFVIKKEVEFCLGISNNWLTRYFFYFSSYKPGRLRMFFSPLFNISRILMVVAYALNSDSMSVSKYITGIMLLFSLMAAILRPYRDFHSNFLLFILCILFSLQFTQINLKMGGLKSPFMVDKYFYNIQLIQIIFALFGFLLQVVVIHNVKNNWKVNSESIYEFTMG